MFYVKYNQATKDLHDPRAIGVMETTDKFYHDQKGYTVVWFNTIREAERFYQKVKNQW